MIECVTNAASDDGTKSTARIVLHWVAFIMKALVMLILLPFGLLYVWVKWSVSRAAFIRAANAAGIERRAARHIAGVFSPAAVMREKKQ